MDESIRELTTKQAVEFLNHTVAKHTLENLHVYSLNQQDMKLAEFATKASNWAKKAGNNVSAVNPAATAKASGSQYVATFANLPLGYYVVSPEAGSTSNKRHTDAMLVNVTATT
ncbi:hypothetical protein L5849_15210, partial [Erythrobacter sp. SN021]|uniref:hypothetical protein n=1 Tax=Erythrobacter sp. SN021 TaxID=2912574 RepID=UPI001F239AD6